MSRDLPQRIVTAVLDRLEGEVDVFEALVQIEDADRAALEAELAALVRDLIRSDALHRDAARAAQKGRRPCT